jgi:hypothetical protein
VRRSDGATELVISSSFSRLSISRGFGSGLARCFVIRGEQDGVRD